MVDVAAILNEVFGPDAETKGLSKSRCARCAGVPGTIKLLKTGDNSGTPSGGGGHTSNQGVPPTVKMGAHDIVKYQRVTDTGTPAHRAHLKKDTPDEFAYLDAFEERAGILEYDAGLQRHDAETRAAQEQGFSDVPSIQGAMTRRWAEEIERLAKLPTASDEGTKALKRARAFISEGWALQAARLGWNEVELFGVSPRAPWQRLDRKGVAFGGAVQAVTADAVVYVGNLRRYRAQVNNDNGAVPIWQLAGDAAI